LGSKTWFFAHPKPLPDDSFLFPADCLQVLNFPHDLRL
jgi:hypothetical protein